MSERMAIVHPCPVAADRKHRPHWRDWRTAKQEGRTVPCEECGITIWPTCSTCGGPETNWETHDHGR